MPQAFHVDGVIQRYDWGGRLFIPELLGQSANGQPCAELWLGAHPKGAAQLREAGVSLADYLAGQHYELPFLLKVLDVRASLSIQVHPDLAQAEAGFMRENAQGIPLNAATRNYKDGNHKPEVMVALTPCVLLYGFSPVDQIIKRCLALPSLEPIVTALRSDSLEAVYRRVMGASRSDLDAWLAPLLGELLPRWRSGSLDGGNHLFWLARAASEHGEESCRDPGLIALLMMNLVHVAPGEAVFQPARLPHAYLHGCNVELMANSDNVLRGGLTSKHIDVDELLSVVAIEPVQPSALATTTVSPGLLRYDLPTMEFSLLRLTQAARIAREHLPKLAIFLNIGEACVVTVDGQDLALAHGESLLVAAGSAIAVAGGKVDLFIAY